MTWVSFLRTLYLYACPYVFDYVYLRKIIAVGERL